MIQVDEIANLGGIPFYSLTPSFLLGLYVLATLTGRLVPRRTYDDKAHEANEWRTESRIKDQQIAEKDTQLRALEEVGRTVEKIMESLPKERS